MGEATIRRDSEFALGLEKIGNQNPVLKRDILDGRVKISKSVIQKLSKYDASAKSFEEVSDILAFVAPKNKQKSNKFTISKDKTVAAMRNITPKSKPKEIAQIRLMLDQIEKMLEV